MAWRTGLRRLGFAALLLLVGWAALAQDVDDLYRDWAETAGRAERLIAANRASDSMLERLRVDVVGWREQFLDRENANSLRIDTLNRQIASLGPPPGENETEPEAIATRRAELRAALAEAQVPRLRATEAYTEADGLIREIDQVLRDRKAREVLRRDPSPLNPLHWPDVLVELRSAIFLIPRETVDRLSAPETRADILRNLPGGLLLVALGIFVVWRGGVWSLWLEDRAAGFSSGSARLGASALVLAMQILLPLIGLVIAVSGIRQLDVLGPNGVALLDALVYGVLTLILGVALIERLFPEVPLVQPALIAQPSQRREARLTAVAMVMATAVFVLIMRFVEDLALDALAINYVAIIAIIPLALLLARIGQIFVRTGWNAEEDVAELRNFGHRAFVLLGRACILIPALGLAAGALGYINLARNTIEPLVLTVALIGLVFLCQRLFARLWGLARTGHDVAEDTLVPTLMGGALILLSLPPLALIWGARMTDLTEVWTGIREGFVLGETRISAEVVLVLLIVFSIGYAITRLLQSVLRSVVLPKTRIDQGAQTAIVSGIGYVGIFLAIIASVSTAGLNLSSLAIVAGALSVGIGFGLQTVVSNFVSGIILLIERPVAEGDWIEVGAAQGYVRRISVRSTRIETFDRTDVIVPNSDLISSHVTNWTHGNPVGRVIVPVSVAYGTQTRLVEGILLEIAQAHPIVVVSPAPTVLFMGFGADGMDFEIRAILRDVNFILSVRSDMNHEIARRFAEAGIEIPFAQRDIWLRNPETLRRPLRNGADRGTGTAAQELPQPAPRPMPVRDMDGDGEGDAR